MKTEKFIFTIVPTIAISAGLIGFYFGHNWLTLVAALFCLPVLFYRFVVETNFLITLSVLPLTILGSYVHESWYGGAALWLLGWCLASLVHSYAKYTPIRRKHKREIAEYKQSTEFKESIEHAKSTYDFDLSGLSCRSANLKFKKTDTKITEAVTKFGGQPVWIVEPQWPISKSTGQPMLFIGQIVIDEKLYGPKKAKMAYIFYAGDETETWDMDSGDNAVILQSGNTEIAYQALTVGPTLSCPDKGVCEYLVDLDYDEDSQFIPDYEQRTWSDKGLLKYHKTNYKTKLGGTPYFLQGDEFPKVGTWQLLLQLKGGDLPLDVDFGLGCAYAYINGEGTRAKFIWQQ